MYIGLGPDDGVDRCQAFLIFDGQLVAILTALVLVMGGFIVFIITAACMKRSHARYLI